MANEEILKEIELYIEFNLINTLQFKSAEVMQESRMSVNETNNDLVDYIQTLRKPPLNQVLFNFIDEKKMSDSEVYHKAGIDRRHFSKIHSNPKYKPKKNTLIALALALELSKDETDELLSAAGYSLTENDTGDLIIQFFLEKQNYDIPLINEVLANFKLKPLTGE